MTTLYGRVVTGTHVRKAVKDTILAWSDTYVRELGRQAGIDLKPLRQFGVYGPPNFPPDQVPGCSIVAPGIARTPEVMGDRTYNVWWAVGVGVVVADKTPDLAVARAEPYGAALRTLLLQQGDLLGFASDVEWTDEETTAIAMNEERTVAATSLQFSFWLENVVDRWAGPTTPPADPTVGIDLGTATDVDITFERLSPP